MAINVFADLDQDSLRPNFIYMCMTSNDLYLIVTFYHCWYQHKLLNAS